VERPLGLSHFRDTFLDIPDEGEPLRIEHKSVGSEVDSFQKIVEIAERSKGRCGVVGLVGDALLYNLNACSGVG
jgi:hypothetical protein